MLFSGGEYHLIKLFISFFSALGSVNPMPHDNSDGTQTDCFQERYCNDGFCLSSKPTPYAPSNQALFITSDFLDYLSDMLGMTLLLKRDPLTLQEQDDASGILAEQLLPNTKTFGLLDSGEDSSPEENLKLDLTYSYSGRPAVEYTIWLYPTYCDKCTHKMIEEEQDTPECAKCRQGTWKASLNPWEHQGARPKTNQLHAPREVLHTPKPVNPLPIKRMLAECLNRITQNNEEIKKNILSLINIRAEEYAQIQKKKLSKDMIEKMPYMEEAVSEILNNLKITITGIDYLTLINYGILRINELHDSMLDFDQNALSEAADNPITTTTSQVSPHNTTDPISEAIATTIITSEQAEEILRTGRAQLLETAGEELAEEGGDDNTTISTIISSYTIGTNFRSVDTDQLLQLIIQECQIRLPEEKIAEAIEQVKEHIDKKIIDSLVSDYQSFLNQYRKKTTQGNLQRIIKSLQRELDEQLKRNNQQTAPLIDLISKAEELLEKEIADTLRDLTLSSGSELTPDNLKPDDKQSSEEQLTEPEKRQ